MREQYDGQLDHWSILKDEEVGDVESIQLFVSGEMFGGVTMSDLPALSVIYKNALDVILQTDNPATGEYLTGIVTRAYWEYRKYLDVELRDTEGMVAVES